MRVAFITTLGRNVGDEFIRDGIRYCLDRVGLRYAAYFVDKHDPASLFEPRASEPERLTDKYWDADICINAGAPVYWHLRDGGSTSVTSEWYEWLWRDRILSRTRAEAPEFLNLGAGSCQPFGECSEAFVRDAGCAAFARAAAESASVTVVRDPVAARMLDRLEVPHELLPCPAFLAGCPFPRRRPDAVRIGVNLMPQAGHYDLDPELDPHRWTISCWRLVHALRRLGKLVFICHSKQEESFARLFVEPGELVFLSPAYRDYYDLVPQLSAIFANRVHLCLLAAGFGVPAVCAGVDTRAESLHPLSLPVVRAAAFDPDELIDLLAGLLDGGGHSERLIALRQQTLERYCSLLAPLTTLPSKPEAPAAAPGDDSVGGLLEKWFRLHPEDLSWPQRFGVERFWFIRESGFHEPETYLSERLRWTAGRAELVVPGVLTQGFRVLRMDFWPIAGTAPRPQVRVNGKAVHQDPAGELPWEFPLASDPGDLSVVIDSATATMLPDARRLGVALRRLELSV